MSRIKIYGSSAGSGKTYTLTLEYIKCLLMSDVNDYFQYILAVSFTKDATNEMKERILAELYGLSTNTADSFEFLTSLKKLWQEEGADWQENLIRTKSEQVLRTILHRYSRLNITTIDSFFQRIVRNLARELGQSSRFDLEMNTQQVLQEAVRQVIEKASCNQQVLEWLTLYVEYLINEGKSWQIEESLETFGKCIYNESFQEYNKKLPNHLNSFAQLVQQQQHIRREGRQIFENAYGKVLYFLEKHQLDKNDFIRNGIPINFFEKAAKGNFPEKNTIIEKCCRDQEAWSTKNHKKREVILSLAREKLMPLLNLVIAELQKVLTARMIESNLYQLGLIGEIVKEIEEQNHEKNRFVISDTNIFLHQMIDENDAPFIYEKTGGQIRHVMIDEFQDTSRLQWKNFRVLLGEIIAQNTFSIIVGDEKQSIYRWRNSNWQILKGVTEELNAEEKRLSYNWRSEKHIIDFNNAFFPLAARMLKDEFSSNKLFSIYEEEKMRQKTNKNTAKGYVSVQLIQNSEENGKYPKQIMLESLWDQLRKLYEENIPAKDICLIVRKNEFIGWMAEYFSKKGKDYPEMEGKHYSTLLSNESFCIKNSLAVKIIISSLEVIAYPDNKFYREQLLYWVETGQLSQNIQEVNTSLLSIPLFELVGYLCRIFKLEQIEGQSAYLFAFYDYLTDYLKKHSSTVHHFLEYWEKEGKKKTIPMETGLEGIRAMTIHKSKGLQFPTVIVPFCDWMLTPEKNPLLWCKWKEDEPDFLLFPIIYKKEMKQTLFAEDYERETAQSYIDNLNLLYVAFTRAEKNLIILAKKEKKERKEFKRVSDILQSAIQQMEGKWDEETGCFKVGEIFSESNKKIFPSDNPLKQLPVIKEVRFFPMDLHSNQQIFRQSNQFSQWATSGKIPINYGNIMHALFSQIDRLENIEKTVERGILQGWLLREEKEFYMDKICQSIDASHVKDWFSGNYKIYTEHSILTKENGIVISKRPDRVLMSEEKTIVIDYKFGKPHTAHKKQLKQYMDLLYAMNAPKIEGYLWYVERNEVKLI